MPIVKRYSNLRMVAIVLMLAALAVLAASYVAFPRAYMRLVGAGGKNELTVALHSGEVIYCHTKADGEWRKPFLVTGSLYSAAYWGDRLLLFFGDTSLAAFDLGLPRERRDLPLPWPVEAAVPVDEELFVFGTAESDDGADSTTHSVAAARILPLGTAESPHPVQRGLQALLPVPETPWFFTAARSGSEGVILVWSRGTPPARISGVDFAVFDGDGWSEPMTTPLPETNYWYDYDACAIGEDVWLFDSSSRPDGESAVGFTRLSGDGAAGRIEYPLGMKLRRGFHIEAVSDGKLAHVFFLRRQKLHECTFDGVAWTGPTEVLRTSALSKLTAVFALVVLALLAVFITVTGIRMLKLRMDSLNLPVNSREGDDDEG